LIHVGRFDPSKNAEMILSAASEARAIFPNLELTFVGSPSTVKYDSYHSNFLEMIRAEPEYSWVNLVNSVPREKLPSYFAEKDIFIHAFEGSLDKTLIEATLTGLPVVTINREYILQFGCWGEGHASELTLLSELIALLRMDPAEVERALTARRNFALAQHSVEHWTNLVLENLLQVADG
jgi:glycosyltransferase involved in cell wall biosynthesis